MTDKLRLRNMIFYGYHGAFTAERELGQRFEVDVELEMDSLGISQQDDLELAINYVDIYTMVKDIVEDRTFKLLESLAETIALQILSVYNVEAATVRVRKAYAPIGGLLDCIEAEVRRQRLLEKLRMENEKEDH
ncbi:MAG: dihydroneopterin aldolase [Limnochordia bacterium]